MQINQHGSNLPTTVASRDRMLPHLPKFREVIKRKKADDLLDMILGDDA